MCYTVFPYMSHIKYFCQGGVIEKIIKVSTFHKHNFMLLI